MAPKPLLLLTLWLSSATMADAATTLPSEIVNFVPPCAQDCLRSFAAANFNSADCGDSPFLACLCRQTGTSGYTIGEGAAMCVQAGTISGACGSGTQAQAIDTAFNMCVGVLNAAPETHSTLDSTIGLPSETSSSVRPTTSATQSFVPTSTARETNAPTAPVPAPATESSTAKNGSGISSTAAIVGISLGCVALLLLGVVLVFLARWARRRRIGDQESGFVEIKDAPGRSKGQPRGPPMNISKPIAKTPVQMGFTFSRPGDVQPPMVRPETVGIAVSSDDAAADKHNSRPVSELQSPEQLSITVPTQSIPEMPVSPQTVQSPARPALVITIPKEGRNPPPARRLSTREGGRANERDSIVTEFAEDGETESNGPVKIWSPSPNEPHSAVYVADKMGNWVLDPSKRNIPRQQPVELPKPAGTTMAEGDRRRLETQKAVELVPTRAVPLDNKVASSNSKAQPLQSSPAMLRRSRQLGDENTEPSTNNFIKPRRRSTRRSRTRERRQSIDSSTEFEDLFSNSDDENPTRMYLPTVVEASPSQGVSPVSYPGILPPHPDARPSMMTPPSSRAQRPNTASQRSPTWSEGAEVRQRSPLDQVLFAASELKYQAHRPASKDFASYPSNTRADPNGSPSKGRIRLPERAYGPPTAAPKGQVSAQDKDQERKQPKAERGLMPALEVYAAPRRASRELPGRSPPGQKPLPPDPRGDQKLQWSPYPDPASQARTFALVPQALRVPRQPVQEPQQTWRPSSTIQQQSNPTPAVANTVSSDLLARRLGGDRAAALTLDAMNRKKAKAKWQRGDSAAQDPNKLPPTPQWKPRLTPTRKGADLVLSVR